MSQQFFWENGELDIFRLPIGMQENIGKKYIP